MSTPCSPPSSISSSDSESAGDSISMMQYSNQRQRINDNSSLCTVDHPIEYLSSSGDLGDVDSEGEECDSSPHLDFQLNQPLPMSHATSLKQSKPHSTMEIVPCSPLHRIQLMRPYRLPHKRARRDLHLPSSASSHDSLTNSSLLQANNESNDDDIWNNIHEGGISFSQREHVLSIFSTPSLHSSCPLPFTSMPSAPVRAQHRAWTIRGVAHRLKIKPKVIRPIVNQLVWEGQLQSKQSIKCGVTDGHAIAASHLPDFNRPKPLMLESNSTNLITCARVFYYIQALKDSRRGHRSVHTSSSASISTASTNHTNVLLGTASVRSVLGKRFRSRSSKTFHCSEEDGSSETADCEDDE